MRASSVWLLASSAWSMTVWKRGRMRQLKARVRERCNLNLAFTQTLYKMRSNAHWLLFSSIKAQGLSLYFHERAQIWGSKILKFWMRWVYWESHNLPWALVARLSSRKDWPFRMILSKSRSLALRDWLRSIVERFSRACARRWECITRGIPRVMEGPTADNATKYHD